MMVFLIFVEALSSRDLLAARLSTKKEQGD
jgi:hypothetical protein